MPIIVRAICAILLLVQASTAAEAHFATGVKLRSIVVTRDADGGTSAFVRTPLPLLFSDLAAAAQAAGTPPDSEFIQAQETATGPVYRVSLDAIRANETAFAKRLESAFAWSQKGKPVTATLISWRIHGAEPATAFNDAASARAALRAKNAAQDPLFGEAYVDMQLKLALPAAGGAIGIASAVAPLPLPDGVSIDNHIVDARGNAPVSYTRPGQLEAAETIDGSLAHTVVEFVRQGVMHILQGIDHVFLVVCLALGVGARSRLLWIVTAFTLGHSATLIATFLGATPSWPWFIPAVETAIAATVLYAAVAALRRQMDSIAVIAGVGLLHGLGFSFVLGEILGRDAPNLIPALASFNVGIEFGQLAVITATLAVMAVLTRLSAGATPVLRNAALAGIAGMSAWWIVERSAALVA
jgi:hypothetical protein